MKKVNTLWLEGYYDPTLIDDFDKFVESWSMGPHAKDGWVWIDGDYYTQDQITKLVKGNKLESLSSQGIEKEV